jgi:hypothetical protein
MEVKIHIFLNAALLVCKWLAPYRDCFISKNILVASTTLWIGGWVGFRNGLVAMDKRDTCFFLMENEPARSPVTIPTKVYSILSECLTRNRRGL